MHKRVLNVLAISIRRAYRVFERNSKLHHWSNSDTLKNTTNQLKKHKNPSFWHKSASSWHKSAFFWHKSAAIACQSGARAAVAALLRQFSPAAWIRLDLIELRLKQIQSSNSNLRSKIRIFVRRVKFVRRKYPPQWVSWGVGGRASLGGLPSAVVRGVWGQMLPLPQLPTLLVGCQNSLATCCGRGYGYVRCVWCLCGACRGARCRFSLVPLVLPSLVLRCGVVLAVCLPCPLPCVRPLLGCWLPPVSLVASLLFTLSSNLLPGMPFSPASALVRVLVFFLAGSSFSLVGPCETKEG